MHRYYCFQHYIMTLRCIRVRSEQASFLPRFVPSYRLSWLPARRTGTKFPAKEMDLRWILLQLFPLSRSWKAKNSFTPKPPNNIGTHNAQWYTITTRFLSFHNPSARAKISIIGHSLITIIANPTWTGALCSRYFLTKTWIND